MEILKDESQITKVIRIYSKEHQCNFPTRLSARQCFFLSYMWEFYNEEFKEIDIPELGKMTGYTPRNIRYILHKLHMSEYIPKVRGGLIIGGRRDRKYSDKRVRLMQYHNCSSISQLILRYLEAGFDAHVVGMLLGYTGTRFHTVLDVQRKRRYSEC